MTANYATFHGKGGYPAEQERAAQVFVPGVRYRVIAGGMGQTSTWISLEGVDGRWASALFDVDITKPPIENAYTKLAPNA